MKKQEIQKRILKNGKQNEDKKKDKYSIEELLEITKGQYGYELFNNFFTKKNDK